MQNTSDFQIDRLVRIALIVAVTYLSFILLSSSVWRAGVGFYSSGCAVSSFPSVKCTSWTSIRHFSHDHHAT